jgi:hypothetical protein
MKAPRYCRAEQGDQKGGSMARSLRLAATVVVAVAALAIPTAASAAPASTSFTITGFEYAFTQTVGFFAGSGTGNAGDRAAWNTSVEHDPLGSDPTFVNGGSFQMATQSPTARLDFVTGTFVNHEGTITTKDPGDGCTNQRFLVTGTLADVATSTTAGGTGAFSVTLTHFRTSLFGRCVTYFASVAGKVSFEY